MSFFQEPPRLTNAFEEDRALRSWLRRHVPEGVLAEIEPHLAHMGELAAGRLHDLGRASRLDEPRHVPFDAWGRRIDRVEVNAAWKEYARVAAEEGVVGVAYERRHGCYSRVHQMCLAYLFAPSSQTYSCPLAMTDGAARTLQLLGSSELRERALQRLVSRDPEVAWTSGQWMTERTGGSDVGLSETVARRAADGTWRLFGTKWFTSAVTSEMALTLARPEGNGPGGKGLALFYLEVRRPDGALNGITVHRLKDKLGTRHLPTAELTLDGTVAVPLAGTRDGVRHMASMLNLTRTWNAISSVAGMQRGLALARDYASRRVAFGAPLDQKPLHLETLADLATDHEICLNLVLHEVLVLGKSEVGEASGDELAALRALQPITKLFTGKVAVASASEVLECFGGAGYVEDTGLPALLRDAQVLSIWEGTTNVLSLETLRALAAEDGWEALLQLARRAIGTPSDDRLVRLGALAVDTATRAVAWAREAAGSSRPLLEAGARRFAITLARSLGLALAVGQADWSLRVEGNVRPLLVAERFASRGIDTLGGLGDQSVARWLATGHSPE